jgi:hypothetical protein
MVECVQTQLQMKIMSFDQISLANPFHGLSSFTNTGPSVTSGAGGLPPADAPSYMAPVSRDGLADGKYAKKLAGFLKDANATRKAEVSNWPESR